MRLSRIIAALLTLVLAASMSQALLSPAEAAAKPKHDLTAKGVEIGSSSSNKFAIRGKITTLPSGKKLKVLRSVAGGKYTAYKKVKPRSSGKFSTRVYQVGRKKTCFKVVAPGTSVYKKTQVRIGCIVTV